MTEIQRLNKLRDEFGPWVGPSYLVCTKKFYENINGYLWTTELEIRSENGGVSKRPVVVTTTRDGSREFLTLVSCDSIGLIECKSQKRCHKPTCTYIHDEQSDRRKGIEYVFDRWKIDAGVGQIKIREITDRNLTADPKPGKIVLQEYEATLPKKIKPRLLPKPEPQVVKPAQKSVKPTVIPALAGQLDALFDRVVGLLSMQEKDRNGRICELIVESKRLCDTVKSGPTGAKQPEVEVVPEVEPTAERPKTFRDVLAGKGSPTSASPAKTASPVKTVSPASASPARSPENVADPTSQRSDRWADASDD